MNRLFGFSLLSALFGFSIVFSANEGLLEGIIEMGLNEKELSDELAKRVLGGGDQALDEFGELVINEGQSRFPKLRSDPSAIKKLMENKVVVGAMFRVLTPDVVTSISRVGAGSINGQIVMQGSKKDIQIINGAVEDLNRRLDRSATVSAGIRQERGRNRQARPRSMCERLSGSCILS